MESNAEPQPVKRKRGRPRKNPAPGSGAPSVAPVGDVGGPPKEDAAAIEWCRAVLWAAEHVNTAKMTERKAGNLLRYSLWQFGRDNPKELVVQLVPKALTLLDKNKGTGEGDDVIEAENMAVKELETLLDGALQEAGLA